MTSELLRFGKAKCLDDHLQVLVKLLRQYFDTFGLNTRAFLNSSFTEESIDLSHMIRVQYEEVLEMACRLPISRPTVELATDFEPQDSPGDVVFKTLHNTIALLVEIEAKLDQMYIEALEVLKWLREAEIVIGYGAYVLRVRNWHIVLSELDQQLQPSLEQDLEDFLMSHPLHLRIAITEKSREISDLDQQVRLKSPKPYNQVEDKIKMACHLPE
jgi:hypothetical protein